MRRPAVGPWLRFTVMLLKPLLTVMTRRDWRGRDNIPESGPVILAVNHISHADPLLVGHFVYDLPRRPHFFAKESLFRQPVIGWFLRGTGQIPVDRGSGEAAAAFAAARRVLSRGEAVIIYPEGMITRDPDLWPMRARTGIARLALETGAPVIPVAQWGAQRIFDDQRRRLHPRPRTPVAMLAGPPVDLSAWDGRPLTGPVLRAATDAVMEQLRAQLAQLRGPAGGDQQAARRPPADTGA